MSEITAQKRTKTIPHTSPKTKGSISSKVGFGFLYLILGIIAVFQIYPLVWLFFFP